ncbi:MAG: response regulator [Proteobacteria bacterium]|nr:response regulator [Pseudomonadota bacterium]
MSKVTNISSSKTSIPEDNKSNLSRIYHVDDSKFAIQRVQAFCKQSYPNCEFKGFDEVPKLIEALKNSEPKPDILFTDINMPEINGYDLIKIFKLSPQLHNIPICVMSAESETPEMLKLKSYGVNDFLYKPITEEDFKKVCQKLSSEYRASPDELTAFDSTLADALIVSSEQLEEYLNNSLSLESLKEIFQIIHTIKGDLFSCQYNTTGILVHEIETLIKCAKEKNVFDSRVFRELIHNFSNYLREQGLLLAKRNDLKDSSSELNDSIKTTQSYLDIESRFKNKTDNNNTPFSKLEKSSMGQNSKDLTGVRIRHEVLDDIQLLLRQINEARFELGSCISQIQGSENTLLNKELSKHNRDIEEASRKINETLSSLRVISIDNLKASVNRILETACLATGKTAKLNFIVKEWFDIDQGIFRAIKDALLHLIRNSADHGIENLEERLARGKSPTGLITIDISTSENGDLFLHYSDDGGGINREGLKKALIRKGFLNEKVASQLSEESLLEMVFLDGFSTRDHASELSGHGVGLSAVKKRFEDFGGSIKMQSKVGIGTQFAIQCPRQLKKEAA